MSSALITETPHSGTLRVEHNRIDEAAYICVGREQPVILAMEDRVEIDRYFRWLMEVRLHVIQELALGTEVSNYGVLWMEEENERICQALEKSEQRDEDEAVLRIVRADLSEWWPDFSEGKLLSRLYRRAARGKAKVGSAYSSREPVRCEAERVANALLTDVNGPMKLDLNYESMVLAAVAGSIILRNIDEYTDDDLMDCICRSRSSRVYYDALWLVYEALLERGKVPPLPLLAWRKSAVEGRIKRPALLTAQSRRPVSSQKLARDFQIQFVIEILRRLGLRPQSGSVSGCSVVSEVLGLSDSAVVGIWQQRLEKKSFGPVLLRLTADMAERTGLHLADDPCSCDPPASQAPAC